MRAARFAVIFLFTATTVAAETGVTLKILDELNHINRMEMDMAHIAKDRWRSQAVRNYADMLQNDHKESQEELEAVAKKLDIKLEHHDEAMMARDEQMMKELKKVRGKDFDNAFAKAMVQNHTASLAELETAQKQVRGPAADLLKKALPVLRKHQDDARKLVHDLHTEPNPAREQGL